MNFPVVFFSPSYYLESHLCTKVILSFQRHEMLLLRGEKEVDADAKHFNFSSSYHMLRRVLCWLSHRINFTHPYCTVMNLPQTHEPHFLKSLSMTEIPLATPLYSYQGRVVQSPAHTSVWIPLITVRLESLLSTLVYSSALLVKRLVFFCVPLLPQLFGS